MKYYYIEIDQENFGKPGFKPLEHGHLTVDEDICDLRTCIPLEFCSVCDPALKHFLNILSKSENKYEG